MTAKKIADYFEVSLDELISGDDWKDYAEKQPVIENAKTGRVQTAVYAISFILLFIEFCSFVVSMGLALGDIRGGLFPAENWIIVGPEPVYCILMAALAYGTMKSIQKDVGPKLAGIVVTLLFLADLVKNVVQSIVLDYAAPAILFAVIDCACIVIVSMYFFTRRSNNPFAFHVVSMLKCAYTIFVAVYVLLANNVMEYAGAASWYSNCLRILYTCSILGLGIFQAYLLCRKRRLTGKSE